MSESLEMVTVSGLPGSGTTTTCRLLVERLGWPHVNAGQLFRNLAAEAGVSLAAYSGRAELDGKIDQRLDARMVQTARQLGRVILEGRLTGWMAQRHGLPALKVWLAAPVELRAARVSRRETQPLAQAIAAMQQREASEFRRYREFHGIDLAEEGIYELVIDTGVHSAVQTAELIWQQLQVDEGQA